jgi:uncharacterized protein YkwD
MPVLARMFLAFATFALVLTGPVGTQLNTVLAATSCLAPAESALLDRLNTDRAQAGADNLTVSPTLAAAARHQAQSMATYGYFPDDYSVQFEGPNHDQTITWQQNIANAGYPDNIHTVRAAIIGSGSNSAGEIARTVTTLPAYRDVVNDGRFLAVGIGFATSDTNQGYWVITLGSLVDGSLAPCPETPVPLAIAGSGRSSNSNASDAVIDGDLATSWQTTTEDIPGNAWVWIDLGSAQTIARIEWLFARGGAADEFAIDVSLDRHDWTEIASKSNGAVGEWRSLDWNGTARYVRFYFSNPNHDAELGYLAEIRVLG